MKLSLLSVGLSLATAVNIFISHIIFSFYGNDIGEFSPQKYVPHQIPPYVKNLRTSNEWPKSRFAYVFLIAGVEPSNHTAGYIGSFANLLVSKYILDQSGSKADVMVMIRMKDTSSATALPPNQEQALVRAGIRITYLHKTVPGKDNFFTASLDKFQMLRHTEYERMLFLDSDSIPLCNMDYLFHMMDRGEIAPNLIIAWNSVPAMGGFFILTNEKGDYEQMMSYIDNYQFNRETGFGHKIQPGDEWEILGGKDPKLRREWNFYGANGDQGLLYHWVRYHKKNVTIVQHKEAVTWGVDEATGKLIKLWRKEQAFPGCGPRKLTRGAHFGYPPAKDHHHFSQKEKPYLLDHSLWGSLTYDNYLQKEIIKPDAVWFTALKEATEYYSIESLVGVGTDVLLGAGVNLTLYGTKALTPELGMLMSAISTKDWRIPESSKIEGMEAEEDD